MPALFDTDGDELRSDFSDILVTVSGHTLMGWANRSGTATTIMVPFGIGETGQTQDYWLILENDGPGTIFSLIKGTGGSETAINMHSTDQGSWYFYCMTYDGSDLVAYWRKFDTLTMSTDSSSHTNDPTDMDTLTMSQDEFNNAFFPGAVAAVKFYDAVLTSAEVYRESLFYTPQRLANLLSWYPLLADQQFADYGPESNDLTEGNTVTHTDDGPPISWAPARHRLLLPPAGVTVQTLRPDSDIAVGGWTPTPSSPTTLFDKIDEVTASDTDYISET